MASAQDTQTRTASKRGSWNTVKPDPKRGRPFSTSLTLAFAFVAILAALIFVLVLASVWEGEFTAYTRQNLQDIADSTAEAISAALQESGLEELDEATAAEAESAAAVLDDISVQVLAPDGTVLYDNTWAEAEAEARAQAEAAAAEAMEEAEAEAAETGGEVVEIEVTVEYERTSATPPSSAESLVSSAVTDADGNEVGTVLIWVSGSEALLTESDASFRTSSYAAIVLAALIATAVASVLGFLFSRTMSKPIQRITSTAKRLRNGDLTARSGVTGADEIGQLGETFDDMAASLERDIELEHRLTGDVAHELRTPLMAVQATVEAMQDGVMPADEEHLERVAGEVRRLSRLIDAMLKLSRLENGTTELRAERTDLVGLVGGIVGAQHALFHDTGLHLRFVDETPHGELYADVDPDLIREALVNLLSNALRYTDEGGWVKVQVAEDRASSEALISVADTGIGIAEEDIPQMFSRFWRSDVSRERASGGLGVGLSITKEIVDKHNGTITVDSELGRGTTFTLRIPRFRQRRSLAQTLQDM